MRLKSETNGRGQALVEVLILLPVLLLLLLAASDFGKIFVISGKSEIAARYSALRWFQGDASLPCELDPPDCGNIATEIAAEVEEIYFDDTLDDGRYSSQGEGDGIEGDSPDVRFLEHDDSVFLLWPYSPELTIDPVPDIWLTLEGFWGAGGVQGLFPVQLIRGSRVSFDYDLFLFPYGREHPLEATKDWGEQRSSLHVAAPLGVLTAHGNFVVLSDTFSGTFTEGNGFLLRAYLIAESAIESFPEALAQSGVAVAIMAVIYLIFN